MEATPPESVERLEAPRAEPLEKRATVAVALIVLVMCCAVGSLWADLNQFDLLDKVSQGERITFAEAQESDDRVATTALLYTIASVLAAITFLLWYSLAYRNTHALGTVSPRYGRKWAVAYWFIPIVNLFRPKQVMNDIWRGSDPDAPIRTSAGQGSVSPLLHWWWAAWLVSGWIANFFIRRAFDDANTVDDLKSEAAGYVATDIADLLVGALVIFVIVRTTRRQEERRRRFESGMLPGQGETEVPGSMPPPPLPETRIGPTEPEQT